MEDKYRDLAVRGATLTASVTEICKYNFTDFNLGDTFTFSFYAKGNVPELRVFFYGATGYVQVANCVNSQGKTSTNTDGRLSFNITSDWQRYWVTWTLKNTGDISVPKYVMLRTNDATSGQTVYVCGCKLETGNKATDWNPAPEDIDNNITDAVDAVEVGSRNIATGTANMVIGSGKWEKGHWRKSGTGTIETIDIVDSPVSGVNKGAKLTASTAGKQIGICQDLIPLNNSDIYTLSCWVRGSTSGLTCRLQPFYASSTDTGGIGIFTLTGKWQYISYTTVRSPLNTATYSGCYVYLIPSANVDTMEVCGLKLERGNKATDWSPAPEDVDAKTNEAAKTATNFMKFNNSVLVIGDMTADPLGNNVLIDSDSVDIRNGNTIRASYGKTTTIGGTTGKHILIDSDSVDIKNGNTILSQFTNDDIYLGKNSRSSTIDLCNGTGRIYNSTENNSYLEVSVLTIESDDIVKLTTGHGILSKSTYRSDSWRAEAIIEVGATHPSFLDTGTLGSNLSPYGSITLVAKNSYISDARKRKESCLSLSEDSAYISVRGLSVHMDPGYSCGIWLDGSSSTGKISINADETTISGKLIGVCQEVTQGSLGASAGATTTKTIKYQSGRTRVLIEMWTTGPKGYYNSDYKTISSSMTDVDATTLTSLGSSVGKYSISSKGDITLYNFTPADAQTLGVIHYRVTHFN